MVLPGILNWQNMCPDGTEGISANYTPGHQSSTLKRNQEMTPMFRTRIQSKRASLSPLGSADFLQARGAWESYGKILFESTRAHNPSSIYPAELTCTCTCTHTQHSIIARAITFSSCKRCL